MKNDKTLTETSYELIDRLETRKRWLIAIILGCFILAPIGLGTGAFAFTVLIHEKGGFLDQQIIYLVSVFIISSLMLLFGTNKYLKFRKMNRSLSQIKIFEETIYKEVLQAKTN